LEGGFYFWSQILLFDLDARFARRNWIPSLPEKADGVKR
jgi:hypothetical protein